MTEIDYATMLDELDRLLNDPDVPLRPGLIWGLLAKVSDQDSQGTMLSRILASDHDTGHQAVQRAGVGDA